ncbi:lmo0937 family membrane protein [Sandarakinorhabdus rubra]|nr:lmo0937 family membrane protein [Sandarakinorhabdus rubra]
MLYGIILVLVVLWALGLATAYTLGGLIHLLLVVALVMLVVNLFSRRRA